jgi:DNA-binding ferritin-like protein
MAELLRAAYTAAESMGDYGLANFLADRQDAHRKHSWMLRSTLK